MGRLSSMRYLIVVLAAVLGLAGGPTASAVSTSGVGDGRLAFTVTRNGEPIGTQIYRIDRQGNRVVVDVHTKIDFRLLWIPIYRFRHESREIWDGDRLVRMISNPHDNGNPVTLDVRADGRVLRIGSEDGHVEVDSKAVPASLWNPLVVERHSLLDTVKGTVMATKATVLGEEILTIAGRKIEAKRYRITGDYSRDLWYDSHDGSLVRVLFEAPDGSEVEFVLKS